jgi:hypothetical protein
MSAQLIALLMFLLLTYLLFRRPASAATGRYPAELNIRVRHSSDGRSSGSTNSGGAMLDLIFLAATILFFLLSLAYVRGCEKL